MKKPKPLTKANLIKEANKLADDFEGDFFKGKRKRKQFIDQVVDYAEGCCTTWEEVYCFVDGLLLRF